MASIARQHTPSRTYAPRGPTPRTACTPHQTRPTPNTAAATPASHDGKVTTSIAAIATADSPCQNSR